MQCKLLLYCAWLAMPTLAFTQSFKANVAKDGRTLCENIELHYSGSQDLPGAVRQSGFGYLGGGTMVPVLTFSNSGQKAVSGVALVVEYLDTQGRPVASIPMVASTDGFTVPFPSQERQSLDADVLTGQSIVLAPLFTGRMLNSCPATASIRYARFHFSDGHVFTWESPGWRVDAIPRSVPAVPKELLASAALPLRVDLEATIDKTGKVVDVSDLGPNKGSLEFKWAKAFLSAWQFYPAVIDGEPVESVQRFSLLTTPAVAISSVPDVPGFVSIRMMRGGDPSDPNRIMVYYGMQVENTRFSPPKSHGSRAGR